MYGLPKDFEGGFFIGRALEMVCFAQFQLILHFEGEVMIAIESAYSYKDDKVVEVPVHESNLMELVGKVVSAVKVEGSGTLVLFFGNEVVRVFDTSKYYESYTISGGGKEIIV